MKILKSLALLSIIGLLALAGASVQAADLAASISQPVAGASYSVGQAVSFSGAATGGSAPYSYVWSFGDGSTTFGQTASHTYTAAGTKAVSLTVTDFQGHTALANVNISIGGGATSPVISNVQATNITQTSVTITWTTDIAANSRVIYDTVSHSDISGQTAPNYGYAASTATSDTSPKVTSHSVQITGLNPGTKYYFRVISE